MSLTATQLRTLRHSAIGDSGNRIAEAMEMLDLTQAQVADAIQVTQPYVSAVATGRHSTITVENAYKFAQFFGCAIEDLFPAKSEVA